MVFMTGTSMTRCGNNKTARIQDQYVENRGLLTLVGDFNRRLSAQPSSIYCQYMPMDIIARLRTQEDGGTGQIFRISQRPAGNAFQNLAVTRGILAQGCGVVGYHVARGYCIHVNTMRCPFIRQGPGELSNPAFAAA